MDCDAEFNALVSMYQSVVHDLKVCDYQSSFNNVSFIFSDILLNVLG